MQAWLTANYTRAKKLPPLKQVIGRVNRGRSRRLTLDESAAALKAWVVAAGGGQTERPGKVDPVEKED